MRAASLVLPILGLVLLTACSPVLPTVTPPSTPARPSLYTPPPKPSPTFMIDYCFQCYMGEEFLLAGQTADCMLPCWKGLIPGKSTVDDVERMINSEFKQPGEEPFIIDSPTIPPGSVVAVQGLGYDVTIYMNDDFTSVQALDFWLGGGSTFSLARAIRELGEPMGVYVELFEPLGWNSDFGASIIVVYKQGITFDSLAEPHRVDPFTSPPENENQIRLDFCLEDIEFRGAGLTSSFPRDFDDFSPSQRDAIYYVDTDPRYRPFEDVFGVSLAAMTQRVLAGKDTCVTTLFTR